MRALHFDRCGSGDLSGGRMPESELQVGVSRETSMASCRAIEASLILRGILNYFAPERDETEGSG